MDAGSLAESLVPAIRLIVSHQRHLLYWEVARAQLFIEINKSKRRIVNRDRFHPPLSYYGVIIGNSNETSGYAEMIC